MAEPDGPAGLPESLRFERAGADGQIGVLRLARPHKRNAIDNPTILGIDAFFSSPPPGVRVVVLDAEGPHFCAGLDLSAVLEVSTFEGLQHSRMWHRAMSRIESCGLPVVAVLKGAVVGGGLELATAAHLRVAEPSTFYALPEGQRGLFVGGGASVRVPRLIGVHRMIDLMLTGRVYDAQEGHAVGLAQYLTAAGEGLSTALDLAARIATISPVTTFAVLQALPLIAGSGPDEGSMMESLMAAVASGSDEAQQRLAAFLSGRAAKVAQPGGPR